MTAGDDPVLAVAVRAARTRGSVVVDAARDLKRLPTFSKEHGEIVSAADMEAEDAIVATIRAAFPEPRDPGRGVRRTSPARAKAPATSGSSTRSTAPPISSTASRTTRCRSRSRTAMTSRTRSCSIRCTTSCFTAVRGKGAHVQRRADARRPPACAWKTRWSAPMFPTRESPRLAALPADVQRARRALRGRAARRLVRAATSRTSRPAASTASG